MSVAYSARRVRQQIEAVEDMIVYELEVWKTIRYETKWRRHYLLKRLLELQLKEFDREN